MSPLDLDRTLIGLAPDLQNSVLTALFVVVSAWWVKGPLLIAIGFCGDLWRRRLPVAAAAAAGAFVAASVVTNWLKDLFGRERPPVADPDLGSPVAVPDSESFPSGHSSTAFAAATAIAILAPRLRFWVLGLAAAVALSRFYLRVHYPLDILAGGLLGAGLGVLVALAAKRLIAGIAPPPARAIA